MANPRGMCSLTRVLIAVLAGTAAFVVLGFALTLSSDANLRQFGFVALGNAGLLAIVGAFLAFDVVEKQIEEERNKK